MENQKILEIQAELTQSKDIVHRNINLVIDRGDKLDDLQEKSENLNIQSHLFKKHAKSLKCRMLLKNIKMIILLLFIILIIILLIIISACGFDFDCSK
jgi:hypothetical protein